MHDSHTPTSTDQPRADGADRLERFDAALERIGHRSSANDRRWSVAGLAAMVAGIAVAVVAYAASTSQADQRDVISSGILATVGVCLVVAGAAVFLRYSITEFLRFWMLRMLLAEQDREEAR